VALRDAIKAAGLPCRAVSEGPGLRIDEHTVYEPDVLVFCGTRPALNTLLIPNPVIVVEVLSPSTRHNDTSAKLIGYFKLPSVAHYLVLDPDARTAMHYTRDGVPTLLADGPLRLDPPGVKLTVEDFFEID
jgi:Uma2 family endonuclease